MSSKVETHSLQERINPSIVDASITKYIYAIKNKMRAIGDANLQLSTTNHEIQNHISLATDQFNKASAKNDQLNENLEEATTQNINLQNELNSLIDKLRESNQEQNNLLAQFSSMNKTYESKLSDMLNEEAAKTSEREENSKYNKNSIKLLEGKLNSLSNVLNKKKMLHKELQDRIERSALFENQQLKTIVSENKEIGNLVNKYGETA